MREIRLKGGHVAIVDDDDFDRVNRISWHLHSAGYAVGHDPELYDPNEPAHKALVLMHRYALGCKPGDGVKVDHRSHNKLDNRKKNLRAGTNSQNMLNRSRTIREEFTSKYRGVAYRGGKKGAKFSVPSKPWVAYYGKKYLGIFETQEEAASHRDVVALKAEGPSAQLNFPKGVQPCQA